MCIVFEPNKHVYYNRNPAESSRTRTEPSSFRVTVNIPVKFDFQYIYGSFKYNFTRAGGFYWVPVEFCFILLGLCCSNYGPTRCKSFQHSNSLLRYRNFNVHEKFNHQWDKSYKLV